MLLKKNKKYVAMAMVLLTIPVLSLTVCSGVIGQLSKIGYGDTVPMEINMSSDKNQFKTGSASFLTIYTGSSTIQTEKGTDIGFDYSDILIMNNVWHTLKAGGTFTNTTKLGGLSSIAITANNASANIGVYWSKNTVFDADHYAEYNSSSNVIMTCDFACYNPNYFKVVGLGSSNSSIKSVKVSFSCTNSYPSLTVASEDTSKGTVSDSNGQYLVGSSLTITATPLSGYNFSAWYEGMTLVSSFNPYTFNMPSDDTVYEAKFTPIVYNVTLSSEDEIKGTVSGSGSYDYASSVTITATPAQGYKLTGWYSGSTLVSSSNPYTFSMPYNDLTYVAKFEYDSYTMSVSSEDTNKGSVTGGGTYLWQSSVTLTATPADIGYSFAGWYSSGDLLISSSNPYTFSVPYNDLSYIGKFTTNSYELSISSDNEAKGTVSGGGTKAYGSSVTIVAAEITGNQFIGWYNGDTLVSSDASYTFTMPHNALTYVAKFVTKYTLTVESISDASWGTVTGGGDYGYGTEFTVTATPADGYALTGWYNENGDLVSTNNSYTASMPETNCTYYAEFAVAFALTLQSLDAAEAGIISGGGSYLGGASFTITATPSSSYAFVGWYNSDNILISSSNPYTGTMPANDYTIYADFKRVYVVGDSLEFGSYPQSKVSDTSLISTLNTAAGIPSSPASGVTWSDYNYYISSAVSSYMWFTDITNNSIKYRGVYFTSYRQSSTSSTSSTNQYENGYVTSTTYWFKYEPLSWRVLAVNSGKYLLMSNSIIDAQDYFYSEGNRTIGGSTVYPNNYKYSHIRSWLNGYTDQGATNSYSFISQAFSTAEQAKIQTTGVYNSAATTNSTKNTYACANTSDKLFLLSYADANNTAYFSDATKRQLKTTDYCQSQGGLTVSSGDYQGNGCWWLRSPYSSHSYDASRVRGYGDVDYSYVLNTYGGVVPALWVTL